MKQRKKMRDIVPDGTVSCKHGEYKDAKDGNWCIAKSSTSFISNTGYMSVREFNKIVMQLEMSASASLELTKEQSKNEGE